MTDPATIRDQCPLCGSEPSRFTYSVNCLKPFDQQVCSNRQCDLPCNLWPAVQELRDERERAFMRIEMVEAKGRKLRQLLDAGREERQKLKERVAELEETRMPMISTGGPCQCCGQREGAMCRCEATLRELDRLKERVAELEGMLLLCSRHTGREAASIDDVPEIVRLREAGKRNVIDSQDKHIAALKAELDKVTGERDRQYDENVARIAAEGAAILRAEKAEAELAAVRESSIEACNPVRYSASNDDPWWMPKLVDHEFCERLRNDYPEDAHLGDEDIAERYEYTLGEYATTWDNLGDAYDQFQRLADAYFNLKQQLTPIPNADPLEEYYRNPGPVDGMVESSGNPFEPHAETMEEQ